MASNRAVRIHSFGDSSVLRFEEAPIPEPHDDEIRVRVRAAGTNPVDFKTRQGQFPPIGEDKLPYILGRDVSGEIESWGPRVHTLRKGDPVMAMPAIERGTFAEHVVLKAVEFIAVPQGMDHVTAAALPLAGLTAWQGLFEHGGLKAGERVLVHGGAGGVGHLAVQFAKVKGATVLTTASGSDRDFLIELGADRVIDYKNERFEDVAGEVDLVFDLIGGETQDRSWSVLRKGGRVISTLNEPDAEKARAREAKAMRYMTLPNAAQLGEIADLVAAGKVRVVIDRTYGIADIAAAQDRLEKESVRGKIVLTVD